MRVDMMMTGLLFNKHVDVRLLQSIGPFTHPRCRMEDYLDFKSLYKQPK